MKTILTFMLIISTNLALAVTAATPANIKTQAIDAIVNIGTMVDMLNSVFSHYSSFSSIPTSGSQEMGITIKSGWVYPTVPDFIANFRVEFSTSNIAIPGGFPNSGNRYTKRISLFAIDHNVQLGCTSLKACVVIDFDSNPARGHLIMTAADTNTTDSDGVKIFNSLFEVYYDKSVSGKNYIYAQMYDDHYTNTNYAGTADLTDLESGYVINNIAAGGAATYDTTTALTLGASSLTTLLSSFFNSSFTNFATDGVNFW